MSDIKPIRTSVLNSDKELIVLEKPNVAGVDEASVLQKYIRDVEKYSDYVRRVCEPEYLYWDKVQYKTPPEGMSNVEYWVLVKQIRKLSSRTTPIKAEDGSYFTWMRPIYADEYLHKIDMHNGGQIFAPYVALQPETKDKFVSRGIIEEAIASSQLEGATTTSPVAKKLILENRIPRNKSEIMIVNNYKTMQSIEADFKHKKLKKELLFEMHNSLVAGQAEESEVMRFRRDADGIIVGNDTKIAHIPPKEKFVAQEIERLIAYANDENDEGFVHPVIKAIFLHFWVGYIHPFTDGNGRLARALFYWYLLKKEYWTVMYLPISTIIRKSPDQYAKAYIWAEQDNYDLTYFFDYHIKKILQAIEEFSSYLNKVVVENREIDSLLGREIELNERQKQAIHHLLAEGPSAYTTVNTHVIINRVGRITARKDLLELEGKGFLKSSKVGKVVRYYPTEKLLNLKSRGS